ncbi:ABC transporter ATP-binding protein [Paenibacillus koleovorans]|uniref:ABC transporter ATP-binding protein n=1 Tax=Paenibacillus koleovorans TaxID=121608 RepID=UPI000FDC35E5|nr:ABC transporter ATP-binding protein [Paenibacillus koleovorans]
MGFLRTYAGRHGKLFLTAVLFVLIESLCDLMQPTIMAMIIDVGVAEGRMEYVWKMGGIMLLVTAFGAIAASTRNIIASHVSQKFGTELRNDLFRKIQTLSFENIDKFERASLVTRLTNDVTQVQNFMNGLMRIFVKAPILCIGSLVMAGRLNPRLALVLAVVVPIVLMLVALNMKIGFPRFMRVQRALDRVNSVMREYLSGVRVVKAFNRFDYEVNKFNDANVEYKDRSVTVMRAMSVFNPAIMLTVNFGIVAVLWFGGRGVSTNHIELGHIIAFINYMTMILFSLMTISMVFNMFVRARASATRINEVFQQENTMQWEANRVGLEASAGRVDFENVSFSYEGERGEPAVRNVSFTCLPGETVGIIGSTGSGKTTLVSLIPRFYDVSSGTVKVDGVDVKQMDPAAVREHIAIVPQKSVLFTGTILENIQWGRDGATEEEVRHAAEMAQAHSFISELPEGYEARLGQKGVNLSGGQKQRVSIARALVRKPRILILDDCTSAVDVSTEAKIKEALRTYARGLTCLIIAQRITSVVDADKIVVLDDGQVVGIGKHEQLMSECSVYQEIYRSQVGREAHEPHVQAQ